MNRNINGTIRFVSDRIVISVIEKLPTTTVGIFDDSANVSDSYDFIEKSLQLIERKIGAEIKNFNVVIKDTIKVASKIKIAKEEVKLADYKVYERDIKNIMELTKQKFIENDRKVTLIQPLEFKLMGSEVKTYSVAPIGKTGVSLEITSAVTTIASETYDYILNITSPHGIVIEHILLSSQSITQNNLSAGVNERGAILISVSQDMTSIAINKFNATVSTLSLYNFGFSKLVKGVASVSKSDYKTAKNLIDVYGDLNCKTNRVILKASGTNKSFTEQELIKIIKLFLDKLTLVVNKFTEQKNVSHIPIVFSGEMKNIIGLEEYAMRSLMTDVSTYSPMSIIENNVNFEYAMGAEKLQSYLAMQHVVEGASVINTNPDSIRVLHAGMKKSLFDRIINKIGGKYDRN